MTSVKVKFTGRFVDACPAHGDNGSWLERYNHVPVYEIVGVFGSSVPTLPKSSVSSDIPLGTDAWGIRALTHLSHMQLLYLKEKKSVNVPGMLAASMALIEKVA